MELWIWLLVVFAVLAIALAAALVHRRRARSGAVIATGGSRR